MKLQAEILECSLWADQPLGLEQARNVRIVCLRGTVWLTLAGHLADVFLQSGESYIIGNNKLALLEAIGISGADIRISVPAR